MQRLHCRHTGPAQSCTRLQNTLPRVRLQPAAGRVRAQLVDTKPGRWLSLDSQRASRESMTAESACLDGQQDGAKQQAGLVKNS